MLPTIVNLTIERLVRAGFTVSKMDPYTNKMFLCVNNEFYGNITVIGFKTIMDALSTASFMFLNMTYKVPKNDTYLILQEENLEILEC